LSDASDPPHPSEGHEAESADRRDLRERAATAQREGLRALESGDFDAATRLLLEAVAAHEEVGDLELTNSVAHYLGVALAEQGKSSRALHIWEEIIDRGWDSPTAFNCLIRHYERQGDNERVQRLYERLQQAGIERTGEFFRFSPQPVAGSSAASDADAAAGVNRRTRVLIADDEPATCSVLERILAPLGYEVVIATNGSEALSVIMSSCLDLILLDVYMLTHSGLDILYRMRAQANQTPVIVMSGHADDTMIRDAKKLGALFLSKPFGRDEVVEMVARHIGDHEDARGDTQTP